MPRKRDDPFDEEIGDIIKARVFDSIREKARGQPQLPEGVITIVFTDVAGSTELVRDLGDEGAHPILRRHADLVRRVIADHEGTEVERAGDSFMVAFRSPSKAVAFALALHDRLAEQGEVRVRIGLDTGEVIREEKGYFGRTVFRAARLCEAAQPGQVLASEATKILTEATAPRFVDLGERELKGLGGSHRTFEVQPVDDQA